MTTLSVPAAGKGPARPWAMAIWALIVLGIVYLTFGGGGTLGIYFTGFRVASLAIVAIALVVWVGVGLRDPFWLPSTTLGPAILVCIGALVVADLGSNQPRLGFDFIAYAVLLAGAYLLLQRLFAHRFFGPRLGMLGVLLCVGLSALYIAAVLNSWTQLWLHLGRIVTPPLRPAAYLLYGNPSPIATMIVLLWVASVVQLSSAARRVPYALAGVTALAGIAVFLAGSRGAWGAFVGAAIVIGVVWLISARRRGEIVSPSRLFAASLPRSRRILAAGTGVLLALAVVTVALFPAILHRLTEPAADTRVVFAVASIRMFLSSPFTGVGPGMWVVDRLHYTDAAAGNLYVPHAHNIALQTLAELGLVGAIAGALLAGLVVRLVAGGARSPDALTRHLAWGASFASVYILAAQMTDSFANLPAIGFAYALIVARLDAMVVAEVPVPLRSSRNPYPVVAALAFVFAAAALWAGRSEQAAWYSDRAVSAANNGDWAAAGINAQLAEKADPGMPPYLLTEGLAESQAGANAEALGHIRQAAEIDDFPTAWLDVARLTLDLSQPEEARRAVSQAMRLGYEEPRVAIGASTIDLELRDRAAAVSAIASALQFAPGLASDPYWSDPTRRPIFEDALSEVLAQAPPEIGYKIALEGGRPEAAQAIVATLPADQRLVPDLVARAWVGDRAAFDQLHTLAITDPLDAQASSLCRRIAERSLDPGWPGGSPWTCGGTGEPSVIIVVRVNPPPSWWGVLPDADAQHYPFAYRRFVPDDDLVPGLPHLGAALT